MLQEGTIPPFGHLFNMPIYIDAEVGQWPDRSNAEVAFCAGAGSTTWFMELYAQQHIQMYASAQHLPVNFFPKFQHHAGSFTEAISMRFEDYLNAVKAFSEPTIGSLATATVHEKEGVLAEA